MLHDEYIRHGSGECAVLFIHGFLGSPAHFNMFIDRIPDEYGIYNILLIGHGGDVKDFAKASMNEWKTQVENAVLQLCEKYSKIIIVAHSMGTLFAYDLSNKYKEQIEALFLLGTPLKICVKGSAFVNSVKSLFGLISDDDEVGKAYANAHSVRLNLKLWHYIGWIPRYFELLSEAKRGRNLILNVKVPCFIFQSAMDELVSRKSEQFIPKYKNISLEILEKSAHFIYDKDDADFVLNKFDEIVSKNYLSVKY